MNLKSKCSRKNDASTVNSIKKLFDATSSDKPLARRSNSRRFSANAYVDFASRRKSVFSTANVSNRLAKELNSLKEVIWNFLQKEEVRGSINISQDAEAIRKTTFSYKRFADFLSCERRSAVYADLFDYSANRRLRSL